MEAFYGSDNVTLEPWAINMSMIDYMSATKSEVTLVNKTALEIAVDVANNVTEEQLNNLVPAVAEEFKAALTDALAVLDDAAADQEQVDAAFDRLATAIQMLDFIKGDKATLRSFVNNVKDTKADLYISVTWSAFAEALEIGKVVLADENAMQEEVDNAYEALVRAYLDLRLVPNKNLLADLINQAKGLVAANYTAETWNAVSEALATAEMVMNNENATQEEVDNAQSLLAKAVEGLVAGSAGETVNKPAVDNSSTTIDKAVSKRDTITSIKTGDNNLIGMFWNSCIG